MTYNHPEQGDKKSRPDPFQENQKGSAAERVEGLIAGRGVREIARLWGIPPSTINSFIERKGDPKLSMLLAICQAEGVRIEWLATGEGPKHANEDTMPPPSSSGSELCNDVLDMSRLVSIPTYDVEAAAGAGTWINTENISDYWYVPRAWLRQERLEHAELHIINTIGDSMAPNINSGDRLLIKTNIDRDVALSGVYVINLDGHLRVKRLTATLFPAGYRIASDNELYPEEFIPADELDERLSIIGEVVRVLATSVPKPEERRGPVRGKTHSPSLELTA